VHAAVFDELLRGNSTSRSALSQREASLRQPFAAADTVRVSDQRYVVAYVRSNLQALPPGTLNPPVQPLAATLTPADPPATSFRSQTTAADALADWVNADPSLAGQLHVIPVAEAAAPLAETRTWSPAGVLPTPASGIDAVRLVSGKVLIAGGADPTGAPLAGTAVYDPTGNAWSGAGPLATARRAHTTTRLPDGGVLAAGGIGTAGALDSAERFDVAANAWAPVPPMSAARAGHSATVLRNGAVLITGGTGANGAALSTVDLFDPGARTWSAGIPMSDARSGHQAVLLDDGRVLVVGGALPRGDGTAAAIAYCELYDPAGTWSPTGSLTTARAGHQATLLTDGRVLVTGGDPVPAPDGTYSPHSLASAEVYDPHTGTWSPAADMPGGRSRHRAVRARTGAVLVIGGTRGAAFGAGYRSVLAYDPAGDGWVAIGALALGRAGLAIVELADRRVLVAGGLASADPVLPEPAATGEVLIP
jgi:N-acetylneuraminic acid mutarotase